MMVPVAQLLTLYTDFSLAENIRDIKMSYETAV